MPNKILISFLGTGNPINREYRKTSYSIDGTIYESPFVASVIAEHYQIPNRIIIGTAKSMWDEIYRYYCDKNGINLDEDYYIKLSDRIKEAGYKTDISLFDLKNIDSVLGGRSKCVVIPYGINREEQIEIFRSISTALDEMVSMNDEIILDITHSFRSLPLYSTSVINYLNDVKGKGTKVSMVLYGMLDAMKEFNDIAPIIDITTTVELNNWSKAAHAFKEYGKGYFLAELIEGNEAKIIRDFSDSIGINYLTEIKVRLVNFQELSESEIKNEFAKWILPDVLSSFVKRLQKVANIHYHFQYELAKWHFEKKNYSSSFIVFVECLISYVCEKEQLDWKQQEHRVQAKEKMQKHKAVIKIYQKTNLIRKNIAHNLSKRPDSMAKDIKLLNESLNVFGKIISKLNK